MDKFSVTVEGSFHLDNHLIACSRCGAGRGLTFTADMFDRTASARCPRGHVWDEPKLNGEIVHDLYRRNTGR